MSSIITDFATLVDVVEYLKEKGWKISKTTIYQHQRDGKIGPNKEGRYDIKSVERYASRELKTVKTARTQKDDELQKRKTLAEIEIKEEAAKSARNRRLLQENRLFSRDDFDLEMAARSVVLHDGIKTLLKIKIEDWIEFVGGDFEKQERLYKMMIEAFYDLLGEYASTKEFEVLFKGKG